MILVEFDLNWADEYNVMGMAVMTLEQYIKLLMYTTQERDWSWGGNDGFCSEPLVEGFRILSQNADDIQAAMRVVPFTKYGAYFTYGHFPEFDYEDVEYNS